MASRLVLNLNHAANHPNGVHSTAGNRTGFAFAINSIKSKVQVGALIDDVDDGVIFERESEGEDDGGEGDPDQERNEGPSSDHEGAGSSTVLES